MISTFNSPLEIGMRVLILLSEAYPNSLDIQKIIRLDHLMIYSGDVGGEESLHTPVPHRSGELLIKHDLVMRGVYLLMSRGLIIQSASSEGFSYLAEDDAGIFVTSLGSKYYRELRDRAKWVINKFEKLEIEELDELVNRFFNVWNIQFQNSENIGFQS